MAQLNPLTGAQGFKPPMVYAHSEPEEIPHKFELGINLELLLDNKLVFLYSYPWRYLFRSWKLTTKLHFAAAIPFSVVGANYSNKGIRTLLNALGLEFTPIATDTGMLCHGIRPITFSDANGDKIDEFFQNVIRFMGFMSDELINGLFSQLRGHIDVGEATTSRGKLVSDVIYLTIDGLAYHPGESEFPHVWHSIVMMKISEDRFEKQPRLSLVTPSEDVKLFRTVIHDSDAEYDYYHYERQLHDGSWFPLAYGYGYHDSQYLQYEFSKKKTDPFPPISAPKSVPKPPIPHTPGLVVTDPELPDDFIDPIIHPGGDPPDPFIPFETCPQLMCYPHSIEYKTIDAFMNDAKAYAKAMGHEIPTGLTVKGLLDYLINEQYFIDSDTSQAGLTLFENLSLQDKVSCWPSAIHSYDCLGNPRVRLKDVDGVYSMLYISIALESSVLEATRVLQEYERVDEQFANGERITLPIWPVVAASSALTGAEHVQSLH